jgi:hypothetical protein
LQLPAHPHHTPRAPLGAFPMPGWDLDLHMSTPAYLWAPLMGLPPCCPGLAQIQLPCQTLTLLRVWSHFLHELNEVFQELGVVV